MSEQFAQRLLVVVVVMWMSTLLILRFGRDALVEVVDFRDVVGAASSSYPTRTLTFGGYSDTGFMTFKSGNYALVVNGRVVCEGPDPRKKEEEE